MNVDGVPVDDVRVAAKKKAKRKGPKAKRKEPAAKQGESLLKQYLSKLGKKRWEGKGPEERSEHGRKMSRARWAGKPKKKDTP